MLVQKGSQNMLTRSTIVYHEENMLILAEICDNTDSV
jgi:hypothetical protein